MQEQLFQFLLQGLSAIPIRDPMIAGRDDTKNTEPFRKITRWDTCSIATEDSLDKQTIVSSPTSYSTHSPRRDSFGPLPLIVP